MISLLLVVSAVSCELPKFLCNLSQATPTLGLLDLNPHHQHYHQPHHHRPLPPSICTMTCTLVCVCVCLYVCVCKYVCLSVSLSFSVSICIIILGGKRVLGRTADGQRSTGCIDVTFVSAKHLPKVWCALCVERERERERKSE